MMTINVLVSILVITINPTECVHVFIIGLKHVTELGSFCLVEQYKLKALKGG